MKKSTPFQNTKADLPKLPEGLKTNRSEKNISHYTSSASLEKKILSNSYHFKIDQKIFFEDTKPKKINNSFKTFSNVIRNLRYPIALNKSHELISIHSTLKKPDNEISSFDNSLKMADSQKIPIMNLKLSSLLKKINKENKKEFGDVVFSFDNLNEYLNDKTLKIGFEIRKEISSQLSFLEANLHRFLNNLFDTISLNSDKTKDIEINYLSLNISHLKKEIELILHNAKNNSVQVEEEKESKEFTELQNKYIQYFESSQKIIKKQEIKIDLLFAQCNSYKTFKSDFEFKLNALTKENFNFSKYKTKYYMNKEKISQLEETIQMQNEEISTIKKDKQLITSNFTIVLNQMKTVSKGFTRNVSFLIPEEKNFFANDILNEVRQVISSEYSRVLDLGENFNFEDIDLDKLQYRKPTFFHCFPISKLKTQNMTLDSRDRMMLVITIRGIFDSKHHEYLITDNYKSYSKFSDFVYSWLCNFYIDEDRRCVLSRVVQANSEIALKFVDEIMKFNKTWELFAMKDFLEEKTSSDEIFFYLHCRFLLFNGPQLKRLSGRFNYIDYVKLDQILKVLDLVFRNFDPEARNFVVNKLKAKCKMNGDIILVNSALALRILLEYYKLERKIIFKLLSQSFKFISKKSTFKDFFSFEKLMVKLFPTCNDLEKIELFRQCYEISKGAINPETIFTVFSESGFLIKIIKSQYFVDPLFENEYIQTINFINSSFKKKNDDLNFIRSHILNFGLEVFIEEFNKYQTIFIEKNYNFYKRNSFLGKNLFMIYSHLMEILMKIRNIEVFNGYNSAENEMFFLKNDFLAYDSLFILIRNFRKKEKLKEFELNRNAKKIQLKIKRKVNKWYSLINQILPLKSNSKEKQ